MATPTLELFFKPTCPYCHKVLSFMKDHNIELPLHDIEADEAARNRLIEVGGKRQVPCLFIDGAAMYESNDIIAYLSKTFGFKREERRSTCRRILHYWWRLLFLNQVN